LFRLASLLLFPTRRSSDLRRRSRCRTLSSRRENRAEGAYCGCSVYVSKGNAVKVLVCPTFRPSPGLATVCCCQDCAELSNCCSKIGRAQSELQSPCNLVCR